MSGSAFFAHPLWSRLAAVHLHFLWQGLVIAWLYWTVVKLFAVQSSRMRYALGMAGLLAMPLSMAVTFWLAEVPEPASSSRQVASSEQESNLVEESFISPPVRYDGNLEAVTSALPTQITTPAPLETPLEQTSAEPESFLTLLLLGGWFLGVMIFGTRLLGGVGTVFWCRWSSLPVTDPECLRLLERLSHQLGLARPPRLAASFRAGDAFSLGLFRPLIVLPAAWLLELPPETLESVLAHELAHIRRWDAWANLFQRILEAWLFYHPAVWWLSRQMDREREKCADLGAVSLTGAPLQYVKALAGVAEFQSANRPAKFFGPGPILATGMGGKNMVLLERVRHILGETPRTGAASRLLAGTLALAIPAALWVGTLMLPATAADDDDKLVAQAREDEEGNRRRDGDAPKPEGRRDGDRPRGEGPRDGDRPRGAGPRDGDRPRAEGRRDGDRPPREGVGPRRPPEFPPRFRDGEGPRGPFAPGGRGFRRDGEGPGPREGDRSREGDRPRGREGDFRLGPQGELLEAIRDLRREVEQLRQEVHELREARGSRPGGPPREGGIRLETREGERPRIVRPQIQPRRIERPEREGERREGAEREGERRERAEREREGEGQRIRIEIGEGGRAASFAKEPSGNAKAMRNASNKPVKKLAKNEKATAKRKAMTMTKKMRMRRARSPVPRKLYSCSTTLTKTRIANSTRKNGPPARPFARDFKSRALSSHPRSISIPSSHVILKIASSHNCVCRGNNL